MYNLLSTTVKCPVCQESLMDHENMVDNAPSIYLGIEIKKKRGSIRISSVYESYNYSCTVETPKNEVALIFCPHCNSELNSKTNCETCSAPMVPLAMHTGGTISFCSRSGCKNHFVKLVDFSSALNNLFQKSGYKKRGRK